MADPHSGKPKRGDLDETIVPESEHAADSVDETLIRGAVVPDDADERFQLEPPDTLVPDRTDTLVPDPAVTQLPGSQGPVDPESTLEQPDLSPSTILEATSTEVSSNRSPRFDALVRGDQIGDFRIQRLLGKGGFGAVYLARELRLDRLVALKVVLPAGQSATAGEGRSLARLKHPGIVGVFGEAHDQASGCSLLWMQFVDGLDLANLINRLYGCESSEESATWDESDLRSMLIGRGKDDRVESVSATLPSDHADLAEAEQDEFARGSALRRTSLEMVCRIGCQLAEALSHAHQSGITHRDIKPANILMQRDGTPLLADFNLAENRNDDANLARAGGTVAYMPPEQLAHVLREQDSIDARKADIYSLGVVLWELACGSRPMTAAESRIESSGPTKLKAMLELRRRGLTSAANEVPDGLGIVLRRAMSPNPSDRYPSAAALATALRGLAQLHRARRRAPVVAAALPLFRRYLFWILLMGGMLPHFAASVLQSRYNQIWIGTGESSSAAFTKAFLAYNVVVYPACMGWLAWNLYRFATEYRSLVARVPLGRSRVRRLRGRLLRLPRQFMIASAVGWFPGAILFPWLLRFFGEDLRPEDAFHYGLSFTIAGLIATTYSFAIVLYVAVCHGYRACWQTAAHYRRRARRELSGMQNRIKRTAILAGVLPLAAAVLLLAIGMPADTHLEFVETLNTEDIKVVRNDFARLQSLHHLVIALVIAGAVGLYIVEVASNRLTRVVRALTLADE